MSNNINQLTFIEVSSLNELRRLIINEKVKIDSVENKHEYVARLFERVITPIINAYNPVISPLGEHYSKILYRARKCKNSIPFKKIKELYNPDKSSGRAYVSDYLPILYASSSIQTALVEINAQPNDIINIAQFSYDEIKDKNYWFVGSLADYYKSNHLSSYIGDISAANYHN